MNVVSVQNPVASDAPLSTTHTTMANSSIEQVPDSVHLTAPPNTTMTTEGQQKSGGSLSESSGRASVFATDKKKGAANLMCPNASANCAFCLCPFCQLLSCFFVKEGDAYVVTHFGKFTSVLKEPGLYFINVCDRQLIRRSLKENTISVSDFKILDCKSNPILVGGAVFYRIEGVEASVFQVENIEQYMYSTFETVLKTVCSKYPYEADEENPCSLKSESAKISNELMVMMQDRMNHAGVRILSCSLTDLSYAPEIAQPMLMRQQAEAMVKARKLIVAGAVGMTEDAINRLTEKGVKMTDAERSLIVKNLLTVICGKES